MNKIKILALVAFMAASLWFPYAAQAQTTPTDTITAEELTGMFNLEQDLQRIFNSGPASTTVYSAEYLAAAAAARAYCDGLGTQIRTITNNNRTSYFVDRTCVYGLWGGGAAGDYDVTTGWNVADDLTTYLIGVRTNGQPAFSYTVWQSMGSPLETGTMLSTLFGFVGALLVSLIKVLNGIIAGIATLALSVLDFVVTNSTNGARPAAVQTVWVIIRDFVNLFFIISLIAIALGTIIQHKSYNRTLIVRLVVNALLINFSMVIASTLIDFSNMLINTVSPTSSIRSLAEAIFPAFVTGSAGWSGLLPATNAFGLEFGAAITSMIALVVMTISFLAIAGLMVVRMIGLWFLLMLSPVAYGLNVLPITQGQAKKWWDLFIKYLIWGPVAMFFLRVAFAVSAPGAAGTRVFGAENIIMTNLVVAGLVYGAYVIAKGAGMQGSAIVTGAADKAFAKAKGYGIGAAKGTARYSGNYFWRGTAAKNVGQLAERVGLAKTGAGDRWGEKVGRATATISNKPGLIKQAWVDDPNKAREKLVKSNRRRSEIKRDYLKDYDEETAKKFSPQDFAYLLDQKKETGDKLLSLLEHGPEATKMAILTAFSQGRIQVDATRMPEETQKLVHEEARKFAWKKLGRKPDELALNPDFMEHGNQAAITRDLSVQNKNGKLKPEQDFGTQLKNSYIKVDEGQNFRRDKDGKKKEAEKKRKEEEDARRRDEELKRKMPKPDGSEGV